MCLKVRKVGQLQVSEVLEHRSAKMKAHLQRADTKGDGTLQDSELKAVRKARRGQRGQRPARSEACN